MMFEAKMYPAHTSHDALKLSHVSTWEQGGGTAVTHSGDGGAVWVVAEAAISVAVLYYKLFRGALPPGLCGIHSHRRHPDVGPVLRVSYVAHGALMGYWSSHPQ
jgi:hypothetical protein